MVDAIWDAFASRKLTIALAAAIPVCAAIALWISSGDGPPAAFETWSRWLELYDPMHSWWLAVMLVGLWLNLLASAIDRLHEGGVPRLLAQAGILIALGAAVVDRVAGY